MPVTIDHTAFPYIIDEIIAYATPEALKVLSATSSSFRRRLFYDVVVHPAPGARKVNTAAPSTPAGLIYRGFVLATPGGQSLPFIPFPVQVLDQVSLERPYWTVDHCLRTIKTLRRMNRAYVKNTTAIYYFPLTVVDFAPVPLSPSLRNRHAGHMIKTEVPKSTTKYILHLRMDHGHMDDLEEKGNTTTPFNTDIILNVDYMYRQLSKLVIAVTIPDVNGHAELMIDAVTSALTSAIRSATYYSWGEGMSITIVGLERLKSPPTRDELCDQLTQECGWRNPSRKFEVRDAMRLVTMDEWWEELGDRKDIEGCVASGGQQRGLALVEVAG